MRASLDQGQPTKSAESVSLSRRYNYIISVLARNDAFHRVRVGEWGGRDWGRRERAHITCVMAPAEAEGGDGYDRDGKRTSERTNERARGEGFGQGFTKVALTLPSYVRDT